MKTTKHPIELTILGLSDVTDVIIIRSMTELALTNGAGADDILAAEASNTVKLFVQRGLQARVLCCFLGLTNDLMGLTSALLSWKPA